jgi:tetratricopeptide (TPR) repeat protein
MASLRHRAGGLSFLALLAGCTSATDRLNDGIALQSQGRYIEAVYNYADAVERDAELVEARDRLVAAGDTALSLGMDEADEMERRGDPVGAAQQYRDLDQMLARVRQVGMRLEVPADYDTIRRAVFDQAVGWRMARGDDAAEAGRWGEARDHYIGARADFLLPSRNQADAAYEAETRLLMRWAETELADGRPRAAHGLAQEAIEVRSSPARDVVLRVRELQERALAAGTVVVAILPVTGTPGVREYLGAQFEIALDEGLMLDHWNQPPLFVDVADPVLLRNELRGLLRGQVAQTPLIVGRALGLIGADLGVLIQLAEIEVLEEDVQRRAREAIIPLAASGGRGSGRQADQAMDTVTYTTLEGTMEYYLEADIVLVDTSGREIERFSASSRRDGPFRRGEFDGDPDVLELPTADQPFFDPDVFAGQVARIEGELIEDLAVAIATGVFDTVLEGVR